VSGDINRLQRRRAAEIHFAIQQLLGNNKVVRERRFWSGALTGDLGERADHLTDLDVRLYSAPAHRAPSCFSREAHS
jgi:hypothetical protein